MPETYLFNLRWVSARLYEHWRRWWWRHIATFYNRADAVVGPSQTAIQYLVDGGLTVSTQVISNGVNLTTYTAEHKPGEVRRELGLPNRPTAVYVGRLSVEKQLDVILKAVKRAKRQLDLQLVLVGDGNARNDLERLAKRWKLSDRVYFTGFLEKSEHKLNYLRAGDIFVMPSTAELQSIVTLEAMASGKPVAAVNAGALPELVIPGENGELFAIRNNKQLSAILLDLLSDTRRLKRYGAASLRHVQTHDLAAMPENHLRLYRKLLAKPRSVT